MTLLFRMVPCTRSADVGIVFVFLMDHRGLRCMTWDAKWVSWKGPHVEIDCLWKPMSRSNIYTCFCKVWISSFECCPVRGVPMTGSLKTLQLNMYTPTTLTHGLATNYSRSHIFRVSIPCCVYICITLNTHECMYIDTAFLSSARFHG